jgi:HEAT repeat protein
MKVSKAAIVILLLLVVLGIWALTFVKRNSSSSDHEIIASLESTDLNQAMMAVKQLSLNDYERALRLLPMAFKNRYQHVRIAAATELYNMGPTGQASVEGYCTPLLDQPCSFDRVVAFNIVGQVRMLNALPALVAALGHKDEVESDGVIHHPCQRAAATALSKIGIAALDPLRQALSSQNDETRLYAVLALKWMGPPAAVAVDKLRTLDRDPNAKVREYARDAIRAIAGN